MSVLVGIELLIAMPLLLNAAPDAGPACDEFVRKVAQTQGALDKCTTAMRDCVGTSAKCEAGLAAAEEKLAKTKEQVTAVTGAKEQLCKEVATFAASVIQRELKVPSECVPQDTVDGLGASLEAWNSVERLLGGATEYAAGVVDQLPDVYGNSRMERRLSRLFGEKSGAPLWNRRLLIAALKLVAPQYWAKLHAQGNGAMDAFFAGRGTLPALLTQEINRRSPEPGNGTPLTTALQLGLVYAHVSGCEKRETAPDCVRAQQLIKVLDDTGPLLVRRRLEDIDTTPCSSVAPQSVRGWIRDFPARDEKAKLAAFGEITAAARAKLFLCYLSDDRGNASYRTWSADRLPAPSRSDARSVTLVEDLRGFVREGGALDRCGRAVRAMQNIDSERCVVNDRTTLEVLHAWARSLALPANSPIAPFCNRIAALLWSGAGLRIPPSPHEDVKVDKEAITPMSSLRGLCEKRRGNGPEFEATLAGLGAVAKALGEPVATNPWHLDVSGSRPAEAVRYERARGYGAWLLHALSIDDACEGLGLDEQRCSACREGADGYDCELLSGLSRSWAEYERGTKFFAVFAFLILAFIIWLFRWYRAQRLYGALASAARGSLKELGFAPRPHPLRYLRPSYTDTLLLTLPSGITWEPWGRTACAVIAPHAVTEQDVHHAGRIAMRREAQVVFLLHADSTTPDLSAVRAMLEWAARGRRRAVHIIPLARARLLWANRQDDLVDLLESTTLRGNLFEVRGPVRSSSQFWNRERIVAGLLTVAETGQWTVVTGLRRFGKSSLCLEVARRTAGLFAYVDLAGFHQEVHYGATPGDAVESILRTLTQRLNESARQRFPDKEHPEPPKGPLDAATLATWMRQLLEGCARPAPPALIIIDEIEQLLSVPLERRGRAFEVMATLVGRLRSSIADPSSAHAGAAASVLLGAAIHPLLWAPLATLGGQSMMGAFPSLCVPALDADAALAMMRGLGARQGIRFEDEALMTMVEATQGVPLLLRRLGTSTLELFDSERARQGALGALNIGKEAVAEALKRELAGGSPTRVWVESEVASAEMPAGLILRALAREGVLPVAELERRLVALVLAEFTEGGMSNYLSLEELKRRAQEAASVMLRLVAESRLLEGHGDLTSPDAYTISPGIIRDILSGSSR